MEKNMTLSGFAGTGKSTIGRLLSKYLGYEFVSIGNNTRKFAQEKYGMGIEDFQYYLVDKPEIDKQIDNEFSTYCNENSRLIIDYRLGFHFIKEAYHIYLKVSDVEAARRISNDNRENEDGSIEKIRKRNAEMQVRFKTKYDVDFADESNYDMVIDATNQSPEEIVNQILAFVIRSV